MEKGIVVIGTIGSDAHTVGNWIITHYLKYAGFKIIQLGSCVSQKEFIDAAIETNADAILVSSMYGLGYFDCEGLKDKCIEAGLMDIILYIGGYLTTTEESWPIVEKRFREIGFNRVYPPETDPRTVAVTLEEDIKTTKFSKGGLLRNDGDTVK